MKKYESDLVIQQLIETNQKLTDQLKIFGMKLVIKTTE